MLKAKKAGKSKQHDHADIAGKARRQADKGWRASLEEAGSEGVTVERVSTAAEVLKQVSWEEDGSQEDNTISTVLDKDMKQDWVSSLAEAVEVVRIKPEELSGDDATKNITGGPEIIFAGDTRTGESLSEDDRSSDGEDAGSEEQTGSDQDDQIDDNSDEILSNEERAEGQTPVLDTTLNVEKEQDDQVEKNKSCDTYMLVCKTLQECMWLRTDQLQEEEGAVFYPLVLTHCPV